MVKNEIYNISDNFKLYCDTTSIKKGYSLSLEEYRCREFFTKEPETIDWIKSFRSNEVFYDIGANIGQYSIYSSVINPSLQVFAFEPLTINYNRMCDNIKLNGTSLVVPLLVGLSNDNLIDKFFIKDTRASSSGNQLGQSIDEHGNSFDPKDIDYVISSRLDDFIQLFKLPLPNHIKIDVDGIEEKIINGMLKTLKESDMKSVLVEVNEQKNLRGTGMNTIIKIFGENGFTSKNKFNQNPNHSKFRRKGTQSEIAENIIFTRI